MALSFAEKDSPSRQQTKEWNCHSLEAWEVIFQHVIVWVRNRSVIEVEFARQEPERVHLEVEEEPDLAEDL